MQRNPKVHSYSNMGTGNRCAFLIITVLISGLFLEEGESKTHWGDIKVLKELKSELNPESVSPGSCVSSWDFTADPCDSIFSERFTCGLRCDQSDDSGASRLTELALDQAGYSGSLTLTLDLPYLQTLDLSGNSFTGPIPDSVGNLTRLRRLGLSRNAFSGEIPISIGALTSLEELYLDNNDLTGEIAPSLLCRLGTLRRLELQNNRLTGEFPSVGLGSLYFLDASNNRLTGKLPKTLPSSIVELSLRNNTIEGKIPRSVINDMSFLQVLDLSHNRLTDSVPSNLFTHLNLQQLILSFNALSSIERPSFDAGLAQSQLIALELNDNDIQGFLPPFFGLMPKLSALSLENNRFGGIIPTVYAIKTAFPGSGVEPFERLLLGGNYLFGPIPSPLLRMRPGSVHVELSRNCLFRCPRIFFFCQGGDQKSLSECQAFGPIIP